MRQCYVWLLLVGIIWENRIHGEDAKEDNKKIPEVFYRTPKSANAFIAESFDDESQVWQNWHLSKAQRRGADDSLSLYDGTWKLEPLQKYPLSGDLGLVMRSRAKHFAISRILKQPFHFNNNKPLVVQYEVSFQGGQECGGAYLKLLTYDPKFDPSNFHEGTPYTIMFGPDKCGNDHKLYFIMRHVNPINGSISEKRARINSNIEEIVRDNKPHVLRLVVSPDNTYTVWIDKEVVASGSLLKDMDPPVNPPKEIDDPSDTKPSDWDDRDHIPDPEAKRPDDWDETQPRMIPDLDAKMPAGWLESESEMVSDTNAVQPEDWDPDMDGEYEPPLIPNPKCANAPGCGPWKAPMKENPLYKEKWTPPLIPNPKYRGEWHPRRIPNPDYFYDENPFKMLPIGAIGFELWSMSDSVYFDNVFMSDNEKDADEWLHSTYDLKLEQHEGETVSWWKRIVRFTNRYPWIWAIYVVLIGLPLVLLFTFCCSPSKKVSKSEADYKKTDEPTNDDAPEEQAFQSAEDEKEPNDSGDQKLSDNTSEEELEDLHNVSDVSPHISSSPRQRRSQKE